MKVLPVIIIAFSGFSAAGSVALTEAVTRAPALEAARLRAEAARERLGSSGRFPDPQLEAMVSRVSMPEGTNPMWEVNLSQPLPRAGERAADRDRGAAGVAMAEADFAVMAGQMAAEAAMAIAEAQAAAERAGLLHSQASRMEEVLLAVDARVATGRGRGADRLALQTAIAGMRLMASQEEQMAGDARSTALSLLDLAAESDLPDYDAPEVDDIVPDQAPEILLSAAAADEAAAMARMARASARPMTAVGLRFEREEDSMGDIDTVGIAFMSEIPWRARGYARAEERAARAEQAASRAQAEAVRNRIQAALSRVHRAEKLAETARRLARETGARLDAEYSALLREAGTTGMDSGSASILMVVDVLEGQANAAIQVVDAELAVRLAKAELWRYAPARIFIN